MKHRFPFVRAVLMALTILAPSAPLFAADSLKPYVNLESFTYSETVPIEAALHEWETSDFESGDQQWSWNWFEAGVQWKWFSLGYLWREDYDLRFSEDTAELYWLASNNYPLPEAKQYELKLRARHFQADGFRVAFRNYYSVAALRLDYELGYSRFRAQDLIDGGLTGSAQTQGGNDYDFVADLSYHYSEDRLFEREVAEPAGTGQAVDLALQLRFQQHHLAVSITDFYAVIDWEQAPYTEGTANSDRKRYDSAGYVRVQPVLSGYEGVTELYRQRLDARYAGEYEYEISDQFSTGVMLRRQYGETLLGASVGLLQPHHLSLGYWPEANLVQVQWRASGWTIAVAADGVDEGVRALTLKLSYQPLFIR